MNKLISPHRILLIVFVTILWCGSATSSLGQIRDWSSGEEYDNKFKNVLIMGLVNSVSLRNDIEDQVVGAARKIKLKATNGMSMFPPELGKPFDDTERVKNRLQEKGFDGMLTVALIDVVAKRYIPPERKYAPLVYYDRFSNYYYRTHALVYKPGYVSKDSRYFIETNLYELKVGSLVWSGRSRVFDPSEVKTFVPAYAKKLFKALVKRGVITQ